MYPSRNIWHTYDSDDEHLFCFYHLSIHNRFDLFIGIFYFSIVLTVCAVFASLASDRIKKDRARWVLTADLNHLHDELLHLFIRPNNISIKSIHIFITLTHTFIKPSVGRLQFGVSTCQSQQASKVLPSKDGQYEGMRDGLIWVDQTENCMMT